MKLFKMSPTQSHSGVRQCRARQSPGLRAAPRCEATSHHDVRQRLTLEREARYRRVLQCVGNGAFDIAPPTTRFALNEPPPETLSDRCAAEWAQWGLADSKLALFSSERGLKVEYGAGKFVCRTGATRAIDSIRSLAMPPLFLASMHRLQGSWALLETSAPERFGVQALADVSLGVERFYGHAPMQVDVQFVVRIFTPEGQYSESVFFADMQEERIGSFSELGEIRVGSANTCELHVDRYCLVVGADETEFTPRTKNIKTMSLSYLDDDLLLEGTHELGPDDVGAWGRDHDIEHRL